MVACFCRRRSVRAACQDHFVAWAACKRAWQTWVPWLQASASWVRRHAFPMCGNVDPQLRQSLSLACCRDPGRCLAAGAGASPQDRAIPRDAGRRLVMKRLWLVSGTGQRPLVHHDSWSGHLASWACWLGIHRLHVLCCCACKSIQGRC